MAVNRVQNWTTATSTGGANAFTAPSAFTAGNLVEVYVGFGAGASSCAVTAVGMTFAAVGSALNDGLGNLIQVFCAQNVPGTNPAITATAVGASYIVLIGSEYSGLALTGQPSQFGTAISQPTPAITLNATAGDLMAGCTLRSSGGPTTISATSGTMHAGRNDGAFNSMREGDWEAAVGGSVSFDPVGGSGTNVIWVTEYIAVAGANSDTVPMFGGGRGTRNATYLKMSGRELRDSARAQMYLRKQQDKGAA
jgi:hypothetical protein